MSTITIDLARVLVDLRITIPELARRAEIPYPSMHRQVTKGCVKLNVLRKLENVLGPLDEYIKRNSHLPTSNTQQTTAGSGISAASGII